MNKNSIGKIGWITFFLLLCGIFMLPPGRAADAHRLWVMWSAGCVGYVFAVRSQTPFADLVKNAALTCIVLGGVSMLYYGEPSMDDDGNVRNEGFPTTFDSKAGAGVRLFFKLFVGAYGGIYVADRVKGTRKEENENVAPGREIDP